MILLQSLDMSSADKRIDMYIMNAEGFAQPKAWTNFPAFTSRQQKEYIEWITEAKAESTRNKRMADMLDWDRRRKNKKREIFEEPGMKPQCS